jgi:small basic protein
MRNKISVAVLIVAILATIVLLDDSDYGLGGGLIILTACVVSVVGGLVCLLIESWKTTFFFTSLFINICVSIIFWISGLTVNNYKSVLLYVPLIVAIFQILYVIKRYNNSSE